MKMIYTTACVWPDDSKIHFLKASAKKFGIDLKPYGIGNTFYRGWVDIKVDKFCEAAEGWVGEGYTHCCYTDGRDSLFLCGPDEIEQKYIHLACPPYLVSCEDQCYPFFELSPNFPDPGHPWRYIGAGQFICEIQWAVDMWKKLRKTYYGKLEREDHDQGWLVRGYADGMLDKGQFILDQGCLIFQCGSVDRAGQDIENYVQINRLLVRDSRIWNQITGTYPCACHWPGGYSSPSTGKDELLQDIVNRLGWTDVS